MFIGEAEYHSWSITGDKIKNLIRGWLMVGFVFVFFETGIGLPLPGYEYDRHPARTLYEIP